MSPAPPGTTGATDGGRPSIRPFATGDMPQVLDLLAVSLGWVPDGHHAAFFSWKHAESPFGPSLAWVAERDGKVIGFRAFLRWEFEQPGAVLQAVRAVDTATAPAARGRGVFTALTRAGLESLDGHGVRFVFNTPNDQSRPGYLKMGWEDVGRVALQLRLASVRSLPRVARARTSADLWSVPSDAGLPAAEVLADEDAVAGLLRGQPPPTGLRTRLTPEVLRWRYAGFPALAYRGLTGVGGPAAGLALFRLRRRGAAVEVMIGEVLVAGADARAAARLAREVLVVSGADYAVATGTRRWRGFVPVPGEGPVLTWRGVGAGGRPPARAWDLSLGDIELF